MFKPKFTITPEVNKRIAEIEKLKTLVDHATILPELEVQLRFRATVESVHSSTSIEGNPLSEQQVKNILHGNTISAPDYAIREVLNYKKTLDWLLRQKLTDNFLTSEQILHIHKLLMTGLLPKEKVGFWRPGPVYIVDEVDEKEIVQYEGPDANLLPKLVDSFLKWTAIKQKEQVYHPVLLSGLIHYLFVSIHPFSDGNGRSTRIITYQYLKSTNYDFRESLSLDTYYLQNRKKYYQSLNLGKTFNDRIEADVTKFLDFFTKGFLHAAQNINHYIQAGKVTESDGKPLRLNQEELHLLDYVYEFGEITISEAIDAMQTTRRTAQRRLNNLVENRILTIEGRGPATKYLLKAKKS